MLEANDRILKRIFDQLLARGNKANPVTWLPQLGVAIAGHHDDTEAGLVVLRYPVQIRKLLTRRQREVGDLVAQGHPDKVIAKKLGIGLSTVRFHLREAERRLGVNARPELAAQMAVLRLLEEAAGLTYPQSFRHERKKERKKLMRSQPRRNCNSHCEGFGQRRELGHPHGLHRPAGIL